MSTEIEQLKQQLAASQAREVQLREAIECLLHLCDSIGMRHGPVLDKAHQAITLPQDTTALEAMTAEAGEVMRERCVFECWERQVSYAAAGYERHAQAIVGLSDILCALPIMTLEDLRK